MAFQYLSVSKEAVFRRVPPNETKPLPVESHTHISSMGSQPGACGLGIGYGFYPISSSGRTAVDWNRLKNDHTKARLKERNGGGCGFFSAGFIDNKPCKEVYKHLRDNFPIVYQSPIRFNVNSGNNFFFAVFDFGEKEMPARYTDPDHYDYNENHDPGFPNGLEW